MAVRATFTTRNTTVDQIYITPGMTANVYNSAGPEIIGERAAFAGTLAGQSGGFLNVISVTSSVYTQSGTKYYKLESPGKILGDDGAILNAYCIYEDGSYREWIYYRDNVLTTSTLPSLLSISVTFLPKEDAQWFDRLHFDRFLGAGNYSINLSDSDYVVDTWDTSLSDHSPHLLLISDLCGATAGWKVIHKYAPGVIVEDGSYYTGMWFYVQMNGFANSGDCSYNTVLNDRYYIKNQYVADYTLKNDNTYSNKLQYIGYTYNDWRDYINTTSSNEFNPEDTHFPKFALVFVKSSDLTNLWTKLNFGVKGDYGHTLTVSDTTRAYRNIRLAYAGGSNYDDTLSPATTSEGSVKVLPSPAAAGDYVYTKMSSPYWSIERVGVLLPDGDMTVPGATPWADGRLIDALTTSTNKTTYNSNNSWIPESIRHANWIGTYDDYFTGAIYTGVYNGFQNSVVDSNSILTGCDTLWAIEGTCVNKMNSQEYTLTGLTYSGNTYYSFLNVDTIYSSSITIDSTSLAMDYYPMYLTGAIHTQYYAIDSRRYNSSDYNLTENFNLTTSMVSTINDNYGAGDISNDYYYESFKVDYSAISSYKAQIYNGGNLEDEADLFTYVPHKVTCKLFFNDHLRIDPIVIDSLPDLGEMSNDRYCPYKNYSCGKWCSTSETPTSGWNYSYGHTTNAIEPFLTWEQNNTNIKITPFRLYIRGELLEEKDATIHFDEDSQYKVYVVDPGTNTHNANDVYVNYNTSIVMKAMVNEANYSFDGWYVKSYVRNYQSVSHSVNSGSGYVQMTGESNPQDLDIITFDAMPYSGYVFDHWEYSCDFGTGYWSDSSSLSYTVNTYTYGYNIIFYAYFRNEWESPLPVDPSIHPVNPSPSDPYQYTLISSNAQFNFVTTSDTYGSVVTLQPRTILSGQTVTISAGEHGSVDPAISATSYSDGTSIGSRATPSSGYRFNYWQCQNENGVEFSGDIYSSTLSYTVNTLTYGSWITFTAIFRPIIYYTVYFIPTAGGSISEPPRSIIEGGTLDLSTVTATPDTGYFLLSYSATKDGVTTYHDINDTITITANTTITAIFKQCNIKFVSAVMNRSEYGTVAAGETLPFYSVSPSYLATLSSEMPLTYDSSRVCKSLTVSVYLNPSIIISKWVYNETRTFGNAQIVETLLPDVATMLDVYIKCIGKLDGVQLNILANTTEGLGRTRPEGILPTIYHHGDTVDLFAEPAESDSVDRKYIFTNWSISVPSSYEVGSKILSTNPEYTYTVNSNNGEYQQLTATFKTASIRIKTHTIGTTRGTCTVIDDLYPNNDTISLTATCDDVHIGDTYGTRFLYWYVNEDTERNIVSRNKSFVYTIQSSKFSDVQHIYAKFEDTEVCCKNCGPQDPSISYSNLNVRINSSVVLGLNQSYPIFNGDQLNLDITMVDSHVQSTQGTYLEGWTEGQRKTISTETSYTHIVDLSQEYVESGQVRIIPVIRNHTKFVKVECGEGGTLGPSTYTGYWRTPNSPQSTITITAVPNQSSTSSVPAYNFLMWSYGGREYKDATVTIEILNNVRNQVITAYFKQKDAWVDFAILPTTESYESFENGWYNFGDTVTAIVAESSLRVRDWTINGTVEKLLGSMFVYEVSSTYGSTQHVVCNMAVPNIRVRTAVYCADSEGTIGTVSFIDNMYLNGEKVNVSAQHNNGTSTLIKPSCRLINWTIGATEVATTYDAEITIDGTKGDDQIIAANFENADKLFTIATGGVGANDSYAMFTEYNKKYHWAFIGDILKMKTYVINSASNIQLFAFSDWSCNGSQFSNETETTLTVTSSHLSENSIIATWVEAAKREIKLHADGIGSVRFDNSNSSSAYFYNGNVTTIIASQRQSSTESIPASIFVKWYYIDGGEEITLSTLRNYELSISDDTPSDIYAKFETCDVWIEQGDATDAQIYLSTTGWVRSGVDGVAFRADVQYEHYNSHWYVNNNLVGTGDEFNYTVDSMYGSRQVVTFRCNRSVSLSTAIVGVEDKYLDNKNLSFSATPDSKFVRVGETVSINTYYNGYFNSLDIPKFRFAYWYLNDESTIISYDRSFTYTVWDASRYGYNQTLYAKWVPLDVFVIKTQDPAWVNSNLWSRLYTEGEYYAVGDQITLDYTLDSGYQSGAVTFNNWTRNGEILSTTKQYIYIVEETPHSWTNVCQQIISANFTESGARYNVDLRIIGDYINGYARILNDDREVHTFIPNSKIAFSADSGSVSKFLSWEVDSSLTYARLVEYVTENKNINAIATFVNYEHQGSLSVVFNEEAFERVWWHYPDDTTIDNNINNSSSYIVRESGDQIKLNEIIKTYGISTYAKQEYKYLGWWLDGEFISLDDNYTYTFDNYKHVLKVDSIELPMFVSTDNCYISLTDNPKNNKNAAWIELDQTLYITNYQHADDEYVNGTWLNWPGGKRMIGERGVDLAQLTFDESIYALSDRFTISQPISKRDIRVIVSSDKDPSIWDHAIEMDYLAFDGESIILQRETCSTDVDYFVERKPGTFLYWYWLDGSEEVRLSSNEFIVPKRHGQTIYVYAKYENDYETLTLDVDYSSGAEENMAGASFSDGSTIKWVKTNTSILIKTNYITESIYTDDMRKCVFISWFDGSEVVSEEKEFNYFFESTRTITAYYKIIPPVTFNISIVGNGTASFKINERPEIHTTGPIRIGDGETLHFTAAQVDSHVYENVGSKFALYTANDHDWNFNREFDYLVKAEDFAYNNYVANIKVIFYECNVWVDFAIDGEGTGTITNENSWEFATYDSESIFYGRGITLDFIPDKEGDPGITRDSELLYWYVNTDEEASRIESTTYIIQPLPPIQHIYAKTKLKDVKVLNGGVVGGTGSISLTEGWYDYGDTVAITTNIPTGNTYEQGPDVRLHKLYVNSVSNEISSIYTVNSEFTASDLTQTIYANTETAILYLSFDVEENSGGRGGYLTNTYQCWCFLGEAKDLPTANPYTTWPNIYRFSHWYINNPGSILQGDKFVATSELAGRVIVYASFDACYCHVVTSIDSESYGTNSITEIDSYYLPGDKIEIECVRDKTIIPWSALRTVVDANDNEISYNPVFTYTVTEAAQQNIIAKFAECDICVNDIIVQPRTNDMLDSHKGIYGEIVRDDYSQNQWFYTGNEYYRRVKANAVEYTNISLAGGNDGQFKYWTLTDSNNKTTYISTPQLDYMLSSINGKNQIINAEFTLTFNETDTKVTEEGVMIVTKEKDVEVEEAPTGKVYVLPGPDGTGGIGTWGASNGDASLAIYSPTRTISKYGRLMYDPIMDNHYVDKFIVTYRYLLTNTLITVEYNAIKDGNIFYWVVDESKIDNNHVIKKIVIEYHTQYIPHTSSQFYLTTDGGLPIGPSMVLPLLSNIVANVGNELVSEDMYYRFYVSYRDKFGIIKEDNDVWPEMHQFSKDGTTKQVTLDLGDNLSKIYNEVYAYPSDDSIDVEVVCSIFNLQQTEVAEFSKPLTFDEYGLFKPNLNTFSIAIIGDVGGEIVGGYSQLKVTTIWDGIVEDYTDDYANYINNASVDCWLTNGPLYDKAQSYYTNSEGLFVSETTFRLYRNDEEYLDSNVMINCTNLANETTVDYDLGEFTICSRYYTPKIDIIKAWACGAGGIIHEDPGDNRTLVVDLSADVCRVIEDNRLTRLVVMCDTGEKTSEGYEYEEWPWEVITDSETEEPIYRCIIGDNNLDVERVYNLYIVADDRATTNNEFFFRLNVFAYPLALSTSTVAGIRPTASIGDRRKKLTWESNRHDYDDIYFGTDMTYQDNNIFTASKTDGSEVIDRNRNISELIARGGIRSVVADKDDVKKNSYVNNLRLMSGTKYGRISSDEKDFKKHSLFLLTSVENN